MSDYSEFKRKATKESDFWWDTNLIRKISTRVSWLLYRVFGPINPNIVTIFGFVSGILGCVFIATADPIGTMVGIGCLLVWVITDRVDGELARFTGRTSTGGAFLDNVVDNTLLPLLLVAMTVYVYLGLQEWFIFLIGMLATTFFVLTRLIFGLRAENLQKSEKEVHPREKFDEIKQNPSLSERIGAYLVTLYDISKRSHNMVFLFSGALIADSVLILNSDEPAVSFLLLVAYLGMLPIFFAITYGTFRTLD